MMLQRVVSAVAVLGVMWSLAGCPDSSTTSSGAVAGVAVPSQVNVVTAN